jgi:hypothetical protein
VRSQGGVGEDGEAGSDVDEALEGRWCARNGVEQATVLGAGGEGPREWEELY